MNETELIGEQVEPIGGCDAWAGWSPLPPGYALDASDPDVLHLLRANGTTAAAFSARGAIIRGVMEAAEHDVRSTPNGPLP